MSYINKIDTSLKKHCLIDGCQFLLIIYDSADMPFMVLKLFYSWIYYVDSYNKRLHMEHSYFNSLAILTGNMLTKQVGKL